MPRLKLPEKEKRIGVSVRLSESERKEIEKIAKLYGVSFSEWIRTAAIRWRPKKEELKP